MSLACVFRVAAGPRLGFGHLMRARALARALGVAPVVSIRGGSHAARIARSLGCRVVGRRVDASDGADVIVVDDPAPVHRGSWLRRAARKGITTVAVVDDGRELPEASLIVNGSIAAGRGNARVLAGSRFYVLDRRIASVRQRPRATRDRRRGRVLVALGGGVHVVSAAARVVDAVRQRCPDASIEVASGFTSGRRRRLEGARWLTRRHGLAEALWSADVAIVAGGVTLYEACAIGTPVVGLAVVAAQRRTIRGFAASGAVLDAGGPGLGRVTLCRVADAVKQLLADGPRARMSRRARQLVDARGADRVAAEIRRLVKTEENKTRG